ncbi:uncharacterized protein LOC119982131 isoform X2 [Tripterygium wilfordii]|uniref:uncharacterized protein LOC119982131 isoform X2 n=1 Tax=Tripterygium wilfordii TaxID=458696 RepID=UPI0018F7FECB|nr:uncharacterized protein LOC119982131 isoform X2 [Tripterygium wilfordii]
MSRNGDTAAVTENASSSGTRIRVGPDPFLVVCRCFSVITSLTAILCIVVNVLSAISSFKDGSDIFNGIFRCYAVVLAFLVVLAETEWGFIVKFWKVLEYWAGRGMLQILESFALAFLNVNASRKKLQGSKQPRIWRNWSSVGKNLNNCLCKREFDATKIYPVVQRKRERAK